MTIKKIDPKKLKFNNIEVLILQLSTYSKMPYTKRNTTHQYISEGKKQYNIKIQLFEGYCIIPNGPGVTLTEFQIPWNKKKGYKLSYGDQCNNIGCPFGFNCSRRHNSGHFKSSWEKIKDELIQETNRTRFNSSGQPIYSQSKNLEQVVFIETIINGEEYSICIPSCCEWTEFVVNGVTINKPTVKKMCDKKKNCKLRCPYRHKPEELAQFYIREQQKSEDSDQCQSYEDDDQ